jgi:hypothetical protein
MVGEERERRLFGDAATGRIKPSTYTMRLFYAINELSLVSVSNQTATLFLIPFSPTMPQSRWHMSMRLVCWLSFLQWLRTCVVLHKRFRYVLLRRRGYIQ